MKLKCPVCGAEDTEFREIPRFTIKLEGFEGTYCDACYIRWVTANIPKLVPVEAPKIMGKPLIKIELPPQTKADDSDSESSELN